jgi:hypothetical protein
MAGSGTCMRSVPTVSPGGLPPKGMAVIKYVPATVSTSLCLRQCSNIWHSAFDVGVFDAGMMIPHWLHQPSCQLAGSLKLIFLSQKYYWPGSTSSTAPLGQ